MIEEELQKEQIVLANMICDIQKNIDTYTEQKRTLDAETEELYNQYRSGDLEVYDNLAVNVSMQPQLAASIKNNLAVMERPFFGKINYLDKEEEKSYTFYIGKHGINKNASDILIVDWRAPVSTIYYDCNLGDGTYISADDYEIPINLQIKRTFDIDKGLITGFYDSAAVTDDELLIKYLSQNKDAVLGDIITTIQQEQNRIIRDKPFHNLIVQGVAGSGKTTVAIHRISYLLYNYSDRFKSSEFCILGSNNILLNYITNSLPDLDVHDTKQFQVEELFLILLDEDTLDKNYKINPVSSNNMAASKSSFAFINALDSYLEKLEKNILPLKEIRTEYGCYMSKEHIQDLLRFNKNLPITEKAALLDERLYNRITLVIRDRNKKNILKEEQKKYRKHYTSRLMNFSIIELYMDFLLQWNTAQNEPLHKCIEDISHSILDVYDLAALALIRFRIIGIDEMYMLKQVIIDEAQDFGISIYYVLKKILYDAKFTLMGDVSQNIHYETGLNDWEELKKKIFCDDKSKFYSLLKSYRNTIEISNYASNILTKSSFSTYPIEPIIRHGNPVEVMKLADEQEITRKTAAIIKQSQAETYETIAIICPDLDDVTHIYNLLSPHTPVQTATGEGFQFQRGTVIIPIHLVKGLEFDVVVLWNANDRHYENSDAEAKRLYVAVTRALHNLHIPYEGALARLLF